MVDVADGAMTEGMTVVVQGSRIEAVAAAGRVRLRQGVRRIDGAGGYLIPGLTEARRAVAAGEIVGPRFVAAGNITDGANPWWPGSVIADTPQRGRFVMDSPADAGAENASAGNARRNIR